MNEGIQQINRYQRSRFLDNSSSNRVYANGKGTGSLHSAGLRQQVCEEPLFPLLHPRSDSSLSFPVEYCFLRQSREVAKRLCSILSSLFDMRLNISIKE